MSLCAKDDEKKKKVEVSRGCTEQGYQSGAERVQLLDMENNHTGFSTNTEVSAVKGLGEHNSHMQEQLKVASINYKKDVQQFQQCTSLWAHWVTAAFAPEAGS